MCEMCNGATWDEVMAGVDERISRHGFTMHGIEPDPDHPPWTYTIGLSDNYRHPELSVLGIPFTVGADLLGQLAGAVRDGDRFEAGEQLLVRDIGRFYVKDVEPEIWDGDMFNGWKGYYEWRGGAPDACAVELIPLALPRGPDLSTARGLLLPAARHG